MPKKIAIGTLGPAPLAAPCFNLSFYETVPDQPVFETVTAWVPRVGEIVELEGLGEFYVIQIRWEWDQYTGHVPHEPRVYVKVRSFTNGPVQL